MYPRLQPYVSQAATRCIRGGGHLLDADGELDPLLLEPLQLRRGETVACDGAAARVEHEDHLG